MAEKGLEGIYVKNLETINSGSYFEISLVVGD